MKKKSKIFLISILIIIVIIILIFTIGKKQLTYKILDDNVKKQISMQYDKRNANTKIPLNISQFSSEIKAMSEKRYNEILNMTKNSNINTIQKLYKDKKLTCEELVTFYLKRIYLYDFNKLNSVMELNPDIINLAKETDKELHTGKLSGIPVLLKGNIGTKDKMHTTAGAYVLKDNIAKEDAFLVDKLKKEGALILGKTNLSEWAYYLSENIPSGYSALGGQTFNPYGKFDVGGSSSGAAVSATCDFAPISIGTETSGSIIYPSSQNSIMALKPSLGLVSRNGIIPLTISQDTAGIMAKNTYDIKLVLNVITGYDPKDSLTKNAKELLVKSSNKKQIDFSKLKIASIQTDLRREDEKLFKKFSTALFDMGLTIKTKSLSSKDLKGFDMNSSLSSGFKVSINNYLKYANIKNIKNISDIVSFNKKDSKNRIPYGQVLIENSSKNTLSQDTWKNTVQKNNTICTNILDKYLEDSNFIISVSNSLSALYSTAGYPAICIPCGYKSTGEPLGITVIASKGEDELLLQFAKQFNEKNNFRLDPKLK